MSVYERVVSVDACGPFEAIRRRAVSLMRCVLNEPAFLAVGGIATPPRWQELLTVLEGPEAPAEEWRARIWAEASQV